MVDWLKIIHDVIRQEENHIRESQLGPQGDFKDVIK